MARYSLPASPTWYCSRVSDCSNQGTLVFGAKRSLFLVDIKCSPPQTLGRISAHQDRVVGVSLNKAEGEDINLQCCSAGEDGKVKVWDLVSRSQLNEHSHHQHKPTTIHWSSEDSSLIASGDDKGVVVVWNLKSGDVTRCMPESNHVYCLEWSPHLPHHLAIGYKNGQIYIVDTQRDGAVLERLRGHDDEVHCISWCPVHGEEMPMHMDDDPDNPFADTPPDGYGSGYLLASGSRDRTVRVWSLSKGKSLQVHKLPTNTGHKYDRYEDRSRSRAWVTVCWIPNKPRHLLSSSHGGEVLQWDLCKPGRNKWDVLVQGPSCKGHQRIIFNISVGGAYYNTACSISMDRQVVLWDLSKLEAQTAIPTLGGFVYAMASAPLNPGRLGIGVGDNMLRVWNYGNPSNPYDHTMFWQGIKSKVTALSWHPRKEGLLAYGTDDGRVGIYDVLSGRAPSISSTYHRGTVYVLAWGPACPAREKDVDKYMLYSCGDGQIMLHDVRKLDGDAVKFNDLVQATNGTQTFPTRSEISWKPDYSVVAVGNDDGSVDIYRPPDLRHVCSVKVHHKLVNCCRWHPEYTAELSAPSSYQSWLAIGSNECVVSVVDLSKMLEPPESGSPTLISEAFCVLQGHSDRITGLAWSPHQEGMLASASYDGSAQVWNVKTGEGVANFRGHSGRLLSVQWSELDADVVFSGSEDFTLESWQVSMQEHKSPPKGKERKKKKKNRKQQDIGDQHETSPESAAPASGTMTTSSAAPSGGDAETEMLRQLLEAKRQELLKVQQSPETETSQPASAAGSAMGDEPQLNQNGVQKDINDIGVETASALCQKLSEAADDITDLKSNLSVSHEQQMPSNSSISGAQSSLDSKTQRKDARRWKQRSLLPVYSSKENRGKLPQQEDCSRLASHLYSGTKVKSLPADETHLGLYMNRLCNRQLIQQELVHHREQGNMEQEVLLELWKGNPAEPLQRAADAGQLNDWLLGIASMASPQLWSELCVKYASQLEKEGAFHKAASYLLAIHKVPEAIDMLARNRLFKDAMCLAQARLHPDEPQRKELLLTWASSLGREGNHEQAAKCYLAANEPLKAAKQLMRRADLSAIKAATHICLVANEMEACKNYGYNYVRQCQLNNDWLSAAEVIKWHECFQPLCLRLCVHEVLLRELAAMELFTPAAEQPFIHTVKDKDIVVKLPKFIVDPLDRGTLILWEPHLIEGRTFILTILVLWHNQWHVTFDKTRLHGIYVELHKLWDTKQTQTALPQVLLESSLEVTLGLISVLRCDLDSAAHWWAVAMATCHRAGYPNLVEGLCRLLLPMGPNSLSRIQQEVTAVRMAVCADVQGLGPAKDRKPSLPVSSCTTQLSQSSSVDSVANDTKYCTSVDSLGAFYYLTVLNHLIQHRDDVALEVDSGSEESESESTQKPRRVLETIPDTETADGSNHDNVVDEHDKPSEDGKSASEIFSESTDSVEKMLMDTVKERKSEGGDAMTSSNSRLVDSVVSLEGSLDSVHLSSYDVVPKDIKYDEQMPEAQGNDRYPANTKAACDNHTDIAQELTNGSGSAKHVICGGSLKILSWSLLWDSQARRNQLLAASQEIQRALARLTAGARQNGEKDNSMASHFLAPPVIHRTISGEYLHMKPFSPRDSPVKDFANHARKRVSSGSIDEESEWMEMKDPDIEPMISENPHGEELAVSMTQSGILQTRIYNKAHQIFSGMSQSGCESIIPDANELPSSTNKSTVLDNDDERNVDDNEIKLSRDKHGESVMENGHSDVPDVCVNGDGGKSPLSGNADWLDLPVDLKYTDSRVTLSDLSMEQVQINKELHNLTCQLQSCPFPDPLQSAKNLITLSEQLAPGGGLTGQLSEWALQYHYSPEHRDFFQAHIDN